MADGREEREEEKKLRELEETDGRFDHDRVDRDRQIIEHRDAWEPERGGS